jgi:hypothetical protein
MTIKAENLLDSLYDFTQTQKTLLERVSSELVSLKDKKIGIETLNSLTNVYRELDALRENVMLRLISSMKRGDILRP